MTEKKYMTAREAAQYTGFSVSHIYRLVSRNAIPHYNPTGRNGKVVFKCEELETWVEQGKPGDCRGEPQDGKGEFLVMR